MDDCSESGPASRSGATDREVEASVGAAEPHRGHPVTAAPGPQQPDEAMKHFVRRAMDGMTTRCELTADKPDHGRCAGPAAAIRLEDGFSDVVCEMHAASAEARGAQVLRP